MPTGRTITAREAGLKLPGMRVIARDLGEHGLVLMPDDQQWRARPPGQDTVLVRLDSGEVLWEPTANLIHEEDDQPIPELSHAIRALLAIERATWRGSDDLSDYKRTVAEVRSIIANALQRLAHGSRNVTTGQRRA